MDNTLLSVSKNYKKLWISKNIETVKPYQKLAPIHRYKITRACIIEGHNHLHESLTSTFIQYKIDSRKLKNEFRRETFTLNSTEYKILKQRKNKIQNKSSIVNNETEILKIENNLIQIDEQEQSETLVKPKNSPKPVAVLNLNYAFVDKLKINYSNKSIEIDKNNQENYSLENRRHNEVKFSEEYKLVKMHKFMSFTETNLQSLCLSAFKRNDKLKSIYKYIDELKNAENKSSKALKSNINSSDSYAYLKNDTKTHFSSAINNSKPNEIIKTIQTNGSINSNLICKFRYSFKLFMNININIINQMLEKRSVFRVCNPRHHCRIIFRLNDFILCEEDKRLSQIVVESSSKLELMLVLDEMNRCFPSWGIWRNGSLCN